MNKIAGARQLCVETVYDSGRYIPIPTTETDYSGKLLLRMPKYLHRRLAETSSREGVNLNQYILFLLSNANENNLAPGTN